MGHGLLPTEPQVTHLTLWLLLSLPANPADTQALSTHRSRAACEQAQIDAHLANQAARCQALVVPAADVLGPVL